MRSGPNLSVALMLAASAFACVSSALAQVAYTNRVLTGCYSRFSSSIDTQPGAINSSVVGTLCFDGSGRILGTSGIPALSGNDYNHNGTTKTYNQLTGTYQVTNTPGDGMGTMQVGKCVVQAFSVSDVDAKGLAHGFYFAISEHLDGKNCKGPNVSGGFARYQGPLK